MIHRLACVSVLALSLPAFALAQETTPAPTKEQAPEVTAEAAPETTAEPVTAATVVATVGETEITVGHVMTARSSLPQQYQQLPAAMLFEGLVSQLVRQEVLEQSFDGEVPVGVELSLENSRRSMLAAVALSAYLEETITDELLQTEYEAQYGAEFEPQMEYNASHILVETEEEAQALIEELEGGADFAALAKEKSTGPSGPNGGALGWFGEGMMVQPFEAAVMELEAGAVSAPVQTQFGWHVIKLNETRQKTPEFEEVKEELRVAVQEKITEEYIEQLIAGANVDQSGVQGIDPEVLNQIELLE